MRLTVVTVYDNMSEAHLREWCRQILKNDIHSKETVEKIMGEGAATVFDKDPNPESNATKTTTFTLDT